MSITPTRPTDAKVSVNHADADADSDADAEAVAAFVRNAGWLYCPRTDSSQTWTRDTTTALLTPTRDSYIEASDELAHCTCCW